MDFTSSRPPINSVRHRVLRNAFARLHPQQHDSSSDSSPLKPGEMQLYSYFTPGLSTGLYDIFAEQTITTFDKHQSKTIKVPDQSFSVEADKFSIDPALIHSTFPLQGVAAQANILPHVVLNDPHLPWQTVIGKTSEKDASRIPWLAVVAFEQSELALKPDNPLFPPSLQGDMIPPQSFTMATRLTVEQLSSSGFQCALPDLDLQIQEDSTLPSKPIDVIYPTMDLFLALFGSATSNTPEIDLDRFKYLAHARQVDTTYMTNAASTDAGQFSIVFSHRTGPLFEKGAPPQQKRCVAHLISLDWVNNLPPSALKSNKRAALLSLFSWTYDCIPSQTVNFEDVMRTVGQNSKVYRTPDEIVNKISNDLPPPIHDRIKNRLDDGYTLLRYRVQTGEETIALMRGPLTPSQVPDVTWMDVHSNTGEDLQIIDTQLGLMDISYCAAWQLGKSLAIADQAFCAALLRIRSNVYNAASNEAKQTTLSEQFEAATSKRVIDSFSKHVTDLQQLSKEPPNEKRWNRPSLVQTRYKVLAEKKGSEAFNESTDLYLRRQVELLASATDGSHYTEVNDPKSTDWDLVLNWILNKIYLEKVPPWYLIPDPTWLPTESIRFFYVDRKWLSALIDGALSVANHLDAQDKVRQCIKTQLQKYLTEELHTRLNHPPQVPSYGFYFRSVVVAAFPDLVVRAPRPALASGEPDPKAEILMQENVRKDIMFCLLDRTPTNDLKELIISQPPHQQCFMFGQDSTFTTDEFYLQLRKVYSVPTAKPMEELPEEKFSKGSDGPGRCTIYDWNTRIIRVDKFTKLISDTLGNEHQKDKDIYDGDANASLVGIELNDPVYRLKFTPAQGSSAASQPPESSDRHSVAVNFPGESAPVDTLPPAKDYAPPFKGTPRTLNVPGGSPRTSGFELPPLSNFRTDKSTTGLKEGMHVSSSQSSTIPDDDSILSEIDYDNMEKCSSRFSPICFSLGNPSTAGDDEPKYLTPSSTGSDIIIRLARNQVDPKSTDDINIFEIRILLGTTANSVLTEPLELDSIQMLNTMRFMTSVGVYKNEVIIHLTPKAVSELSPLSHNRDLSFMIKRAYINSNALDSTVSIVELYRNVNGDRKVALNYIHHVQAKKE